MILSSFDQIKSMNERIESATFFGKGCMNQNSAVNLLDICVELCILLFLLEDISGSDKDNSSFN